jgi:mono/diheme cytochrome c family protein
MRAKAFALFLVFVRAFALVVLFAAAILMSSHMAVSAPTPYQVAGGTKVDAATLAGWRTWRALACERCHGAEQEGLVGPSLVESLRLLSKEQFEQTVLSGRPDKGMPNFSASKMVVDNIDGLYAYLKGRSDGAIQSGHLEPLEPAH